MLDKEKITFNMIVYLIKDIKTGQFYARKGKFVDNPEKNNCLFSEKTIRMHLYYANRFGRICSLEKYKLIKI